MVDKEKIMEEGMKKYFLQKAVISNEGTKVKQTIFLMINCIYYLHILSYFLQIEAHKVNYKANDENSLYMNVDFGLFNYMR